MLEAVESPSEKIIKKCLNDESIIMVYNSWLKVSNFRDNWLVESNKRDWEHYTGGAGISTGHELEG